ncbi:DUF1028 domain-containing protein [Pseudoroseomonas globiformis]|uniref:DUF1028 domain-containing protein n=1 Tax=Teichococcus globiformis TaxID=2307229 RepID=A0ABV7FTQ0_9PROT
MTFSLLGRCARTGQIGAVVTTSAPCVGARVPHLAAGIGGVLTQHRTDPRLGPRGLALMRSGCTAAEAVAALAASTPDHGWRQFAALDASGGKAAFSGARNKPVVGVAEATDCIAIGNILAHDQVPPAMAQAFAADAGLTLDERLLQALEAGEEAGGEGRPLRSAALVVVAGASFPLMDLRIDAADRPLPALRALWEEYRPLAEDYLRRALDPDSLGP